MDGVIIQVNRETMKLLLAVALLAVFWIWETWQPLFARPERRFTHASRNLAIALFNSVAMALLFGSATVGAANWADEVQFGLLHHLVSEHKIALLLSLLMLDAWMYVWHRVNHAIRVLWRSHRMHHSDTRMDVTTATRFHLGEHVLGGMLRLGVIILAGVQVWHIVIYEMLVIAVTQFHHANISLGRFDRWLRVVVVTPDMHKIHHSRERSETDSNYATVFSIWDRLAATFRMRADVSAVRFGVNGFDDEKHQMIRGMLMTPLENEKSPICEADAISQD